MIAAVAMLSLSQSPDFAAWGREALDTIRRNYYLPKSKLYAERPDRKQPCFNWGVGVMLSALNAAARYDAKFKPWLREYADASRVYWNKGGYDVLPAPKPLDRYYDDNAWMALALVETHEILGDAKYLDWAKGALTFALSGESPDGGVFWRERDRASRNTCSNAPTAAACLAVARHTHDPKMEAKAEELVAWTRLHLEDPADGLFWDNLSNGGKIEKTKWTYNSALMIRCDAELKAAGLAALVEASKKRWLRGGKIADPGRFAHLLLEAWLQADGFQPALGQPVAWVHARRSARGFTPPHWAKAAVPENPEILDQAAFARACFVLARAEQAAK